MISLSATFVNTNLFAAAITFLFASMTLISFSQENAKEGEREKLTPEQRAEKMTERMDKELDLTDGQKAKIKEINLQAAKSQKELRDEIKKMREEIKAKHKALMDKTSEEIEAVLNEDQLVKWGEMKGKHKAKMEAKRKKHKELHNPRHPDVDEE